MDVRINRLFESFVPFFAVALAALVGWSIVNLPLGSSHPLVLGLVALALVAALFRPHLGVLLLLTTIWLSALYEPSGQVTLNRVVGIAALTGLFARRVVRLDNKPFVIGRFDYIFGAYVLAIMASVFVNGRVATFELGGTVRGLVMGYLLYFLMVNTIDSWQKLRNTGWLLLACSLVIAAGSIGEALKISFLKTSVWETSRQLQSYGRGGGYFAFIGPAAEFSFIGIILVLWLVENFSTGKTNRRYMLYMLLPIFGIGLFVDGNRAMFSASILAAMTLALLSKKSGSKLKTIMIVSTALVVSAYIMYPLAPQAVDRAVSVLPYSSVILDFEDEWREVYSSGYATRIAMAQAAWNMFLEKPILGTGFDSYKQIAFLYSPQGDNSVTPRRAGHNVFFTVLAETGLIGAILLILMFREVIIALWRSRRMLPVDERLHAANCVLALLLGSIINMSLGASTIERPVFVTLAFCKIVTNLANRHLNEAQGDLNGTK